VDLNSRGRKSGQYPSGGPLAYLIDIWHAVAPIEVQCYGAVLNRNQVVSEQLTHRLAALLAVAVGKFRVTESAGLLDGGGDLEATPAQNLLEGTDDATGLVGQDVEGPHGAAGTDQDSLLALVHGDGDGQFVLAHHAIDHTVEEQLESAWHIAPIAGGANDEDVALGDELEDTLGIVGREDTLMLRTALHTGHTGAYLQVIDALEEYLSTASFGLGANYIEHLRNIARLARAGV